MGARKAKIISRDAFAQAFIEGEMRMRRELGNRMQVVIATQTNKKVLAVANELLEIVIGKESE